MPVGGIMQAEPTPVPLTEKDLKIVDNLTGWNVGIGIGALTLGLFLGVLQGLEHAGF
jgi:hypothetical protein